VLLGRESREVQLCGNVTVRTSAEILDVTLVDWC
jgi:hypothetical protein